MVSFTSRLPIGKITALILLIGITAIAGSGIMAQSSGGVPNVQIGFDRPEAWALKRFDAALLPSTMLPVAPDGLRQVGAISVGVEADWLPMLSATQQTVGFNGTKLEDLNEAPALVRPVIGVQMPWKLRAFATAPLPISTFGIKPRLFAFGVERPLLERGPWTLDWQAYGQVGSVKGAITCPASAVAAPPGSPANPTDCVALSSDIASLRYAGSQLQVAHSFPQMPKLVLHASVAGTFDDVAFQSHGPTTFGLSQLRQWAHGGMFSTAGGVTYLFNQRIAFTVDVFYTPLEVRRTAGAPVTNDGLFNVRGLLSYQFGGATKEP
ncbi:MAG TPA: hypothetical protein VN682_25645 [Terriglobales bacterium]|nr:hypothetical protein [Terriglobales bacterium]